MPEKMSANRARDSRETVRRKRRERTKENLEFYECIRDIVSHPAVLEMKKYYQHCDTDCYEHCLDVAYNNYKICKKLGLDARSAARGGMLHDLFLYDWREHSKEDGRPAARHHPSDHCLSKCLQIFSSEQGGKRSNYQAYVAGIRDSAKIPGNVCDLPDRQILWFPGNHGSLCKSITEQILGQTICVVFKTDL